MLACAGRRTCCSTPPSRRPRRPPRSQPRRPRRSGSAFPGSMAAAPSDGRSLQGTFTSQRLTPSTWTLRPSPAAAAIPSASRRATRRAAVMDASSLNRATPTPTATASTALSARAPTQATRTAGVVPTRGFRSTRPLPSATPRTTRASMTRRRASAPAPTRSAATGSPTEFRASPRRRRRLRRLRRRRGSTCVATIRAPPPTTACATTTRPAHTPSGALWAPTAPTAGRGCPTKCAPTAPRRSTT